MNPIVQDLLSGVGLLALLLVAMESGFRLGRRSAAGAESRAGAQVGAVQGAILGLLGLLLGFSFAAAGSRFLERQDLITSEANAIGTAYLRTDLLDEPARSGLRTALRQYTEHRIEASKQLRAGFTPEMAAEVDRSHTEIWTWAAQGVAKHPEFALVILNPVNEVIDLHSTRIAAGRKHLPMLVMSLLIASSALAVGTIGFGSGLSGRRAGMLTVPLAILIAMALWITIDLDHPRAGMLQLSDAPLKALRFDAPG